MSIAFLGLSFHTAPVDLREQFARTDAELDALLSRHGAAGEIAVLATCNRCEVYVADRAADPAAALVRARACLAEIGDVNALQLVPDDCRSDGSASPSRLPAYLVTRTGLAAVEHLCAVAAGLESMVLGEAQILGQVGDALQRALRCGAAGRLLGALFRHAIVAGRQVRNETALGQGAASISHAAVLQARAWLGDLRGAKILIIGAGKMAELAARALADQAIGGVRVLNRDPLRATQLASRFGGVACTWDELEEVLAWADVAISSTGAPHTLIHAATVAQAMRRRPDRPLALVDVALPRDIDRAVAEVPGVWLADIDDLQAVTEKGLRDRMAEVPTARAIVAAEAATYLRWYAALDVTPTIADLRDHAEQIRGTELQRALRHLGELSPREQRAVEALSVAIVNKLMHTPIVELKRHAADPRFAETARTLFALPESPLPAEQSSEPTSRPLPITAQGIDS